MKFGTKIRTLYEHSQVGTIVTKRHRVPGPGWHIVRFDDGSRLCIHEDMMVIRND
jgi:hypothetical protein